MKGLQDRKLTERGDSAPRFLSRKNDAESMDAMASIIGFDWLAFETLIGGSEDQTLYFEISRQYHNQRSIDLLNGKIDSTVEIGESAPRATHSKN